MLSADDPLPIRPRRVLVAGVTGSGKTTMAGRIGETWGLRHVEIDGMFHGENWTPRPEFLDEVRAFAAGERWVTEWQYTSKGTDEILTPRAELAIWLDYPYRVVRSRLLRRTLSRSILRTRMWNGNVEKPLWRMFRSDPEENILAWQTKTLGHWAERMPMYVKLFPNLTIVRLRHPREAERWLRRQSALRLAPLAQGPDEGPGAQEPDEGPGAQGPDEGPGAQGPDEGPGAQEPGGQGPEVGQADASGTSTAPPKRRSRDR